MNDHFSLKLLSAGYSTMYEMAKSLCTDQRVTVLSRTWINDEQISVKGKVIDNFNFVNHMSFTKSVRMDAITDLFCDCSIWKKRRICAHCIALAIESDSLLCEEQMYIENNKVPTEVKEKVDDYEEHVLVDDGVVIADEEMPSNKDSYIGEYEESKADECILDEAAELSIDQSKENTTMQIVFGSTEAGEKLIWFPNDTDRTANFNMGIIGTMGTGKTQFTKSLITQLKRQECNNYDGSPINMLIFDYKGDYNNTKPEFTNEVNAKVIRPYMLEFNPFVIYKPKNFTPLLPTHIANGFVDTLTNICPLGPKQRETIIQCILDAYHKSGINEEDPNTWNRVAPTFDQVYKEFEIRSDSNDSLAAVMNKINRFHIFEKDPMKARPFSSMMKGVYVIDISGYEKDMQDLIVAITLDQFYSYMYSLGSSKTDGKYRQITNLILVDEADGIMSRKHVTLKKILKEGREFGVGVILSTQLLAHFGTGLDVYSSYIFTWVIHRVNDLTAKDISMHLGESGKANSEGVDYSRIKDLQKHQSVVKIMDAKPTMINDLPFWQILGQTE